MMLIDAIITRKDTLRGLRELAAGQVRTLYAQRLFPYVEQMILDLPKNGHWIE